MKQTRAGQFPEQKWLRTHLEELIQKRAGDFLVVAEGEGFVNVNLKQALSQAKKKYPKAKPLIMEIPREKDFLHVLISLSLYRS